MTISENANERVDCHYDRWFVVQSLDSEQPVSKLSPFIIDKAIRSAVGTVKIIRSLRSSGIFTGTETKFHLTSILPLF